MIQRLSQSECLDLIGRSRLARLGCAADGQPYVVPMHYVSDGVVLYSASTFGRKIETMRANPSVCVEIDELLAGGHWESVVATGQYEELPPAPDDAGDEDRDRNAARPAGAALEPGGAAHRARALLTGEDAPWQPGNVRAILTGNGRQVAPIFFRIRLQDITGQRLAPPPPPDAAGRIWRGARRLARQFFPG